MYRGSYRPSWLMICTISLAVSHCSLAPVHYEAVHVFQNLAEMLSVLMHTYLYFHRVGDRGLTSELNRLVLCDNHL